MDNTKRFFQRTGELAQGAVSRPLSALSKMLEGVGNGSDDGDSDGEKGGHSGNEDPNQYQTPPRNVGYQARVRSPLPRPRSFVESGSPSRSNFLGTSPIANWLPRRQQGHSPQPSQAGNQTTTARVGPPGDDRLQVDEMYARSQIDFSAPASGT